MSLKSLTKKINGLDPPVYKKGVKKHDFLGDMSLNLLLSPYIFCLNISFESALRPGVIQKFTI